MSIIFLAANNTLPFWLCIVIEVTTYYMWSSEIHYNNIICSFFVLSSWQAWGGTENMAEPRRESTSSLQRKKPPWLRLDIPTAQMSLDEPPTFVQVPFLAEFHSQFCHPWRHFVVSHILTFPVIICSFWCSRWRGRGSCAVSACQWKPLTSSPRPVISLTPDGLSYNASHPSLRP